MNHDKHDRKLRAKFESFSPSVDETALWEGIEAALHQPTQKRRYLFLLFAIGFIGSASILSYFRNNTSSQKIQTNASIAKIERNILEISANPKLFEPLDATSNRSQVIQSSDKPSQKRLELNTQSQDLNGNINRQKAEELDFKSNLLNNAKGSSISIKNATSTRIPKTDVISALDAVPLLPISPSVSFVQYVHKDMETSFEFIPPKYIESELRTRWTFGFNAGIGKTFSTFSSVPESVENGAESLAGNLDINYRLSKHWSISFGLSYQKYVSRSHVTSTTSVTSLQQDTIGIIQTPSNVQVLEGPREFLTTTRQTHLRHQITQQLLAPITLRYMTSLSEKWNVQLGIGYGLSIWSKNKGIIQDSRDIVYNLSNDTYNRLRPKGNNRLIMESYLSRNIAGLGKLKLGVNYLHDLNGRYINNTINQKKSHLLQFSGGLTIPLNF